MLHNEKGISLAQVVVGVIIVLILGTVIALNVFGSIKDARLASELQKIEEIKLRVLSGEEIDYEKAKVEDLQEEVRQVLGYHQDKGTKLDDVVFQNKVMKSEGKLYVGDLSVEEKDLNEELNFELSGQEFKKFNVGVNSFYQIGKQKVSEVGNEKTDVLGNGIAAGYRHTLYKNYSGEVYSWGGNLHGQLGDGSVTRRLTPVKVEGLTEEIKEVRGGFYHSVALTSSGEVYSWGANSKGQLGDGSLTQRLTPVKVAGMSGVIEEVVVGVYHNLVLTSSGEVYSWGWNGFGQLGHGSTTDYRLPVKIEGLPEDVKQIIAGEHSSFALTESGEVYSWGRNRYGELGDGTTNNQLVPLKITELPENIKEISVGGLHSLALTSSGEVYGWGRNSLGQLGDGTTVDRIGPVEVKGLTEDIKRVSAGRYYSMALTSSGEVYSWGQNSSGQLGDGTEERHLIPVKVIGISEAVVELKAGYYHVLALNDRGDLYSWGTNFHGQLGDGSDSDRSTPEKVEILK